MGSLLLSSTAFGFTVAITGSESADEGERSILRVATSHTPYSLSYLWELDEQQTPPANLRYARDAFSRVSSRTGTNIFFTPIPITTGEDSIILYLKLTVTGSMAGSADRTEIATHKFTVNNLDPMPAAVGTIPDQTLTLGIDGTVDVATYFSSSGTDTLTYTVDSADTAIATVTNAGSRLTLSPRAVGATTITVTAASSNPSNSRTVSQTFMVMVYPMPTAVGTIPDQTLTLGIDGTVDVATYFAYPTLTYTVDSGDTAIATVTNAGSRLTLSPQAEGSTTITVTVAASDNSALRTASQTFMVTVTARKGSTASEITTLNESIVPRLVQAVAANAISAVGQRIEVAFSGSPQTNYDDGNRWRQNLPHYLQSLADGADWQPLLGDTAFVLPLNAADDEGVNPSSDSGSGLAVWGSSAYTNLDNDGDDDNWNGSLFSIQLGLDQRVRDNLLVGGLLSRSQGDIDYMLNDRNGEYTHKMTSIHPYLAWSEAGVNLWGSAGYGRGKLEITEGVLKNSADTKLWSLAAGFKRQLPQSGLRIKSDISLARSDIAKSVDGDFEIAKQIINNQRLRLLLESTRDISKANGILTPLLEIGARYDGDNGVGVLLGAGARYANATGLTVAGKVHALFGRNDYKEWGVSGVIRQQTGVGGRGLSLSVSPSYGHTAGNAERIWQGSIAGNRPDDNVRLDVNIGYGLSARGGLLIPYSTVILGEPAKNYRLGLRWNPDSSFNLHLFGEHKESSGIDGIGNTRIILEIRIWL